jgi:ribosomal protein S18 acetylase RimI-like enzyme
VVGRPASQLCDSRTIRHCKTGVMTTVRRAGAEEIGAAVTVWQAANSDSTVPGHADSLRGWARDPDALLLVAENGGRLVGMVLLLPGRDQDGAGDLVPGLRHLTGLAVRPESQRSGVGSALLDAAVREAADREAAHVTLWTAEDNAVAQRLFVSRGFAPTGRSARDGGGTVMLHFERSG